LFPDEDEMLQIPVQYTWVADPNGFRTEYRAPYQPPPPSIVGSNTNNRVVLSVVDLDETTEFYQHFFEWQIVRKRSNLNNRPREASFSYFMVWTLFH
jgi:hypothetical protein